MAIAELSVIEIWDKYIRYIGAGGVAAGGLISLVRAIPTIISSFKGSYQKYVKNVHGKIIKGQLYRTEREIPMKAILISLFILLIAIALLPQIKVGIIGGIFIIIFSFFFVTVSSRIVGLVGSSSNPASGMTIATLLFVTVIFALMGNTGAEGEVAALSVGAIVCMAICVAGDTSQDLKTGYLVGATPLYQQIGELIGVLSSALFIGLSVYLLHAAYGIGPGGQLQAPQATLMAMVIDGVMNANLPWVLVGVGAVTAVIVELIGISALPFSVGLYLPIYLSTPIMVGGIIKWLVNFSSRGTEKNSHNRGILYASGLIAGEAVIGIVLAMVAWLNVSFGFLPKIFPIITSLLSLFMFCLLGISLYLVGRIKK